ncbi:MAG: transposase, partial [Alphaproteobacteria bacterium]|nr:transposase [Alphaproteobacteria bacterium]
MPGANQTSPNTDVDRLMTRVQLLEQENRWLKQQLFGRSSEKRESRPPAN